MTVAKKFFVAVFVAMLAVTSAAQAQVMKQVPANAMAVLKVANLDSTSKKVADLATALGLVNYQPELKDPLSALLKPIGITGGVNRGGEMALVMLDPDAVGGDASKAVLGLFPVTDYPAFLANFPDAKTEGGITTVQFKNSPDPSYLAKWGDYAAVCDSKEYLANKPVAFIDIAGLSAKEMNDKDLVIYANMKVIRPKVLPLIEKGRSMAMDQLDQAITSNQKIGGLDLSKLGPVLKVALTQIMNCGQELVNDTDGVTYAVNLSPDGIATTFQVEFRADSKHGKFASSVKNTDEPLLGGLPDSKYLMFWGSKSDGKVATQWISDFLAPIQKSIADLGADYAPVNDYLDSMKTLMAAQTSSAAGLVAPTAALGQGSLFQMLVLRGGDAKTIMEMTRKMYTSQDGMMKALGMDAAVKAAGQSYTPGAKTLDGVTFDEIKQNMNMGANTPGAAQAKQFLTLLYGAQGMEMYVGVVNEKTSLLSMGLPDATLSTAIAAAKSGEDVLSKSNAVKAVAGQLPTQRALAFYLPLDVWASTGLNYAKQFGMDMGVKLPDDLPPIGMTAGTQGSAVRLDAYVPTQLLQALTAAGLQLYMSTQHQMNPNGGAAAPAPAGGL